MPFTRLDFVVANFIDSSILFFEWVRENWYFTNWKVRIFTGHFLSGFFENFFSRTFSLFLPFTRHFYNWLIRIFTGLFLSGFFKIIFSRDTKKVVKSGLFFAFSFAMTLTAFDMTVRLTPLDGKSASKWHRTVRPEQTFVELIWRIHSRRRGFIRIFLLFFIFLIFFI